MFHPLPKESNLKDLPPCWACNRHRVLMFLQASLTWAHFMECGLHKWSLFLLLAKDKCYFFFLFFFLFLFFSHSSKNKLTSNLYFSQHIFFWVILYFSQHNITYIKKPKRKYDTFLGQVSLPFQLSYSLKDQNFMQISKSSGFSLYAYL